MKRLACLALVSLALAGCYTMAYVERPDVPPGATEVARAVATIKGDGISGTATLIEFEMGTLHAVHVRVKVHGDKGKLEPGLHGVHLHAKGDCSAANFTSAGGHFDPGPNGNSDPDANHPYHMGDLPNMEVDANGNGELAALTSRVTLTSGPVSLFDEDGSAIVIHKNRDQGITGPSKSGVSGGPRAACGVIAKP
jgi:Cu-Zn family superoxide dismutase